MGLSGHGTTLEGESAGSIGEITRIAIGGLEASEIEVTTMDSTDAWREFIAGLLDAGELEIDLRYEKSNFDTILGLLGGSNDTWTITIPDDSTFVCDGFFKTLGNEMPVDGGVEGSASIRLSGKPVFSASSG